MARTLTALDTLTDLLDASGRPIYAVDARRRIVYCNGALANWLEMEPKRIVGRLVEFHSQPDADRATKGEAAGPLADLCPPPRALAGEPCAGTISCVARGGPLVHRRADFVPLGWYDGEGGESGHMNSGVLVLLSGSDLSPQELATELSGESSADELHRTIRQFRRAQAGRYAIESLMGDSSTMRKVRAQVAAAATSGANTLICGRPGTGRGHVARTIHYRAAGDSSVNLVPIDCEVASDDLLRRAFDALRGPSGDARHRPTLLLENLEHLEASHQSQLLAAFHQRAFPARIIAIADIASKSNTTADSAYGTRSMPATIDPALLDTVSTIVIHVPRLVERLEDLPVLAQFFLEAENCGSGKQVGSLRPDALDLLTLYTWPGELDELREAIAAAHRTCNSHETTPADLPAVVHHASHKASRIRRQPERIVLDELLSSIEREAIVRALAQAGGNKTEAADLLGMTRPRLYRRLVQLGLAGETAAETEPQGPEFIEREPSDDPQ